MFPSRKGYTSPLAVQEYHGRSRGLQLSINVGTTAEMDVQDKARLNIRFLAMAADAVYCVAVVLILYVHAQQGVKSIEEQYELWSTDSKALRSMWIKLLGRRDVPSPVDYVIRYAVLIAL